MYNKLPSLYLSMIITTGYSLYESVIAKLYAGIQCKMCAERFESVESEKYAQHLDWHFSQNSMERNQNPTSFRKWYCSEDVS